MKTKRSNCALRSANSEEPAVKRSQKVTPQMLRLTATNDGRLLSEEGTPVDGHAIDALVAQGVLSKDAIVLIVPQDEAATHRAAEFTGSFQTADLGGFSSIWAGESPRRRRQIGRQNH
jgi:hypothetical protein